MKSNTQLSVYFHQVLFTSKNFCGKHSKHICHSKHDVLLYVSHVRKEISLYSKFVSIVAQNFFLFLLVFVYEEQKGTGVACKADGGK